MANTKGQIFGINGPVVKVKGSDSFEMQEMVYVGNEELIGEVIGVTSDTTIVQVYEETTGLKKGEPVVGTGGPRRQLCQKLYKLFSNLFPIFI